jgi:outer membrane protein OmpA-like peptidoglycan-associated protein
VRENFCKKKLALEDSEEVIDAAIAKVGERMSDTNYRNRVTVYYLLAEHFGKLGLFGGAASGAGTAAAAASATVAAATVVPIVPLAAATPAAPAAPEPVDPEPAPAPAPAPVAATEAAAAPAASTAPAAPATAAALPPGPRGVYTLRSTAPTGMPAGSGDGFMGLAAVVFGGAAAVMIFAAIAGSYIGGTFDAEAPPPAAPAPAAPAAPAEPAAPAIPDGAGIVSEVVEGRPKVSVFFDVGKNEIAPEFTAAVAPIKAWLDANPSDRVQLSGFTDPTGDAAANAELAKRRAQAVAAALTEQGVAEDRMDLVKPADSSDEATDLAGARRVEITVTPG